MQFFRLRFFHPLLLLVFLSECSGRYRVNSETGDEGLQMPVFRRKSWPVKDWPQLAAQKAGLDEKALAKLSGYLFERTGTPEERRGIRTDAVVIIYKGNLVFEQYAAGFHSARPHILWSASKSILNAMYGIAAREKLFTPEDSASRFYPAWKGTPKEKITMGHLLQMSSGLEWDEGYESSPLKSSVIAMLYTRGRADMGTFAAEMPLVHEPGRQWFYSSGTSNILSMLLAPVIRGKQYLLYPWKKLAEPLGIRSLTFERDGSNRFVASSYAYMTARDLAKFAFLFLNDGNWNGKKLLADGWVKYSTRLAPAFYSGELSGENIRKDRPGAHWWLNRGGEKQYPRPWPDAPRDTFAALGHWGQSVHILPSQDLIIVRLGDDRDGTFSMNTMLKLLLQALPEKERKGGF